jgi:hypothetical protein
MSNARTALLLALPLLAVGCKTSGPSYQAEHWSIESVPARMVKQFTGYRADRDGNYIDYQYGKKKAINATFRRHFLGNSPGSPNDADDLSQTKRRPPHSISPDPLYYFGAESLFIGAVTLGWWGVFVPIPIDSVIGTVTSDEGWSEMGRGFTEGADAEAAQPVPVSQFRVKNR